MAQLVPEYFAGEGSSCGSFSERGWGKDGEERHHPAPLSLKKCFAQTWL